jgi:RIO-like serine/threonine protein kinase
MATRIELKRGSLGNIYRENSGVADQTVRDLGGARWLWLARCLARREARALARLDNTAGFPKLIVLEKNRLVRSFLPGQAMYLSPPRSRAYFREALRLVRRLHRLRITHNDLAKEANWICHNETPGIVDFQLSICFVGRSRLFRLLAREDLRHLLKHKRHYLPQTLTKRERDILANPMWPARCWRTLVKPVYRFLTRRILGWPERDGAVERQRPK